MAHFLSLLGEAERKLGAPEAALAWHRKALAADPKMNTVHYYTALAYMDLKKDDEAIGELEASIQSPFVAPELYLTLGSLYVQRKRYREAEDLCRKAIALDPAHSESYLNLAQLFNAQRLSSKALDALYLALAAGQDIPHLSLLPTTAGRYTFRIRPCLGGQGQYARGYRGLPAVPFAGRGPGCRAPQPRRVVPAAGRQRARRRSRPHSRTNWKSGSSAVALPV